jgi:hypothetical protein
MPANDMQVGGDHYKKHGQGGGEQHWDRVARLGLSYFQGQITKYVERYRDKNGVEDLLKAKHFLDKLIEVEQAKLNQEPNPAIRDQKAGVPIGKIQANFENGVYEQDGHGFGHLVTDDTNAMQPHGNESVRDHAKG